MNFLRRHVFIITLIAIFGAARFVILCFSQTHVHSDEAIIGLMGKHISEGRSLPFYMYGQPYNAAATAEAYLAAIPFKMFGVGVIALKSCIVALSLVCLLLFYKMANVLFDRRTAIFSTLAFALAPSLLKWHFQVRGYSLYFLSIPILLILFWRVVVDPRRRNFFLFGLVSGLSIWLLELSLTLNAALWLFLLLWRTMSIKRALIAMAGFAAGYAPAIIYNLTHNFANWREVFLDKTGGSLGKTVAGLLRPANLDHIFVHELPKFFGPDTVLWYYPERTWTGVVCYTIAAVAIATTLLPFARRPWKLRAFFACDGAITPENKDLLMVALTAACFVPYLLAPVPTPSYFLAGIFFLSILSGRLVTRSLDNRAFLPRLAGIAIFGAMFAAGIGAMIQVGTRNEIETLTLCDNGNSYCLARFPGADIDKVESHLRDHYIASAWTTVSFTYPLLFETREAIAISDAIFGWEHNVYPPGIPRAQPRPDQPAVFIIESNLPLRKEIEHRLTETAGSPPLVSEYGTLAVIEQR